MGSLQPHDDEAKEDLVEEADDDQEEYTEDVDEALEEEPRRQLSNAQDSTFLLINITNGHFHVKFLYSFQCSVI